MATASFAVWQLANGNGTLSVDDTPYEATYSFRLQRPQQVTADGFASFIGKLANLDEPPLRLRLAAFNIEAGPAEGNLLYFSGGNLKISICGIRHLDVGWKRYVFPNASLRSPTFLRHGHSTISGRK